MLTDEGGTAADPAAGGGAGAGLRGWLVQATGQQDQVWRQTAWATYQGRCQEGCGRRQGHGQNETEGRSECVINKDSLYRAEIVHARFTASRFTLTVGQGSS